MPPMRLSIKSISLVVVLVICGLLGGLASGSALSAPVNGRAIAGNSASGSAAPSAAPAAPLLLRPADHASGVTVPPILGVTVTDPHSHTLDVSFYGRAIAGSNRDDFSLVIFPDSQYEAQNVPQAFISQAQWIVSNQAAQNIVFVTHVGDIVNHADDAPEWANAAAALNLLDAANIPYSVGPGNHDLGGLYDAYFGPARFSAKSWYGGHYGSDNANNYSLFSASGMDFILVNLQYNPNPAMLAWADSLLKAYAGRRGIVVCHAMLNVDNSWYNQDILKALKSNPNLFLMLCGHMHTSKDGAAYRAELGDDGHTIHVMLADYQEMSDGNGYLRILRFSPAHNTIYATTFSPYVNAYITTFPDQMEMPYDMGGGLAFSLLGIASGVASGAVASVTWNGVVSHTDYEWYALASNGSLSSTSAIWSFTTGADVNQAPNIIEGVVKDMIVAQSGTLMALKLTLHAADEDHVGVLTWTISTQATFGRASITGKGPTVSIGYIPRLGFTGSDRFVVQVADTGGATDTLVVNVTVAALTYLIYMPGACRAPADGAWQPAPYRLVRMMGMGYAFADCP
jgi:hypothetical protein